MAKPSTEPPDILAHLKINAPHRDKGGLKVTLTLIQYPIRAICIIVDSSPQRYERFLATQRDLPPKKRLSVICDVRIRWNSTYNMCKRAVKFRQYINKWLKDEIALRVPIHTENLSEADNNTDIDSQDLKRLRLSAQEWSHLEMVTEMLSHFKTATMSLNKVEDELLLPLRKRVRPARYRDSQL
ncbi:Dimer-Tnp-hAT domain-containing protein [Curvularia clavata]|uniref:Dimer-Tnp-hAT domain-containing protein n=1 Tax=Curvularia clavata TaxID=95742 RepID=A0A9Q9DV23_CURCL|nr:Dimer-Tnp-hAT domain-containing protein [Curvularia clavata]